MQILVATDFSTRSNRAIRQAGLLAQPRSAQLHLVHVVDDDQPEDLIGMESREAERVLAEQISSMAELRGVQCRSIVVTGDPFDGILRAATAISADLIVMGTHRKQLLLDIFIGTTIERVIRKGAYPVLMVNNEAQHRYENIVAAIDMSDASANALQVALSSGLISNNRATLLHAFWPLAKGKMFTAGSDNASIIRYVESERRRAFDELSAFLAAKNLPHELHSLRVEEGEPMKVISNTAEKMRPDLLVMGTRGRSGVVKALIGSVTEEALRSLNVDILAVPSAKQ